MNTPSATTAYQTIGSTSSIESASRERLVQMLLDGALERIAVARGHMQRNEVARKGEQIGRAISIVEGLRASLNPEAGEISANLEDLYTYIASRLLAANAANDESLLDEAASLLREIKSAWDVIARGSSASEPA